MENGEMQLLNIGYTQLMYKKFSFEKENSLYVIEEDLVGCYLMYYDGKKSVKDFLLDSFEEAIKEAESRFGIPKTSWKEV